MKEPHRQSKRTTPPWVRRRERIASILIAAGGYGTIVAVVFIFIFLFSVVLPLVAPANIEASGEGMAGGEQPIACGIDDLSLLTWTLDGSGVLRVRTLADGRLLATRRPLADRAPVAWAFSPDGQEFGVGFADGSVRAGSIAITSEYPPSETLSAEVRHLAPGESRVDGEGVLLAMPNGQFRRQTIRMKLDDPVPAASAPIVALDVTTASDGSRTFAVLSEEGRLAVHEERREENFLTGEISLSLDTMEVPFEPRAGGVPPFALLLNSARSSVFLLWRDGHCRRYDTRLGHAPVLAETVEMAEEGAAITAATFLLGRTTIVAGDAAGRLQVWFVTKPPGAETADGGLLTRVHRLPAGPGAVTSLSASQRSRVLLAGYAGGTFRLYQTTNANLLAEARPSASSLVALAIAPKDDGILSFSAGEEAMLRYFRLDLKHAEVSIQSLFGEVWYEGHVEPEMVWQSTGGTDDFEPKYGILPLVFGTIKATLYSILIAAPIALLAAVFTSEFMVPRWRSGIKSAVEMMASLPSVVLGFLAALVVAPFLEDTIPQVLVSFATVPFCVLLGARLWHFLPAAWSGALAGLPRFLVLGALLPAGILLAGWIGPLLEGRWFGGNFREWLDGNGEAFGGAFLLLFPVSALLVAIFSARVVHPVIRRWSLEWETPKVAAIELARYLLGFLVMTGVAYLLAYVATAAGWDPRGGIFGRYAQRNALIVGAVMGFAIVPIIYTIAEDALSSVPRHLREASLGAGATPWQTASRVVIPAAMSGLFGALMVGFGRAVGETMIVLMAAGNTPIMEWNVFEGFRTLSANIATEAMEAPKDGTHYRVLFLTALVLFLMTFVLNTAVEVMRRRFRRRFADL